MNDEDFFSIMGNNSDVLTHMYDYVHESDEDDWTSAILGNNEEVIRQLVG